MKKLFTFLVLLCVALVSYALAPGQDGEVIAESGPADGNWKIVKVDNNTYRLQAHNPNNPVNFQNNPSDNDFKGPNAAQNKTDLQNCTGTLTVSGNFSNIGGFSNNYFGNFETVDLSGLHYSITETVYIAEYNYQAHDITVGFAGGNNRLSNFFAGVKTLTMAPDETVYMKFFDGASNCKLETLNFTTGTKKILGDEKKKYILDITTFSTVNFNSDLEEIGNWAFYYGNYDANSQSNFTTVSFPSSLKRIGGEAFHGTKIDHAYLSGCTNLQTLDFECFEDCEALDSINFPANSAFTFLGNDAFKGCKSIVNVDMSMCEGIEVFQANPNTHDYKTFNDCSSLKTFVFPPNLTEVPANDNPTGVFKNCPALEYIRFTGTGDYVGCELQNKLTIGNNAFGENKDKLKTVIFSNNLYSIATLAFKQTAIEEIHIPASVNNIDAHAFYKCAQLKVVYFDDFNACDDCGCVGAATTLAGGEGASGQGVGAFEECQNITDVYINTMAELNCLNNAFDQDISWGAGDPGKNFATLHFPKEKTAHYVNLEHYLTDAIIEDNGLFHKWLMAHYKQAVNPHKNGWYEFINAGPTDPNAPEYQDIILRTFSDWTYSYLVPNGLRAYVVNSIGPKKIIVNEVEQVVPNTYEVTLKRIRVIPAKTGVILYGHPNGKTQEGKPTLVLTPVGFAPTAGIEIDLDGGQSVISEQGEGLALCRDNWDDNYVKNYLEPILSENGADVPLKPYDWVMDKGVKKVTFRNFGLGRYTDTDYQNDVALNADSKNYVGFFRMKDRSYKSGYAYLRLTGDYNESGVAITSEFPVASGGEILVRIDDGQEDGVPYYYEYDMRSATGTPFNARTNSSLNPKGWWDEDKGYTWNEIKKSWGDRIGALGSYQTQALKYFGELEEDADGIIKIDIPVYNNQGDYYTLQGVRVTNPTKGVYIVNGKKVIIK